MPLIKGRVLRVDVALGMTQLVIFSVHNHGLTKGEVQHVCGQIRCALRHAADNLTSYFVVVLGDLNYSYDSSLIFHRPSGAQPQHCHDHKVHAPIWAATLGKLMEMSSEAATHFCKFTTS
eukprot:4062629-Pyramimonas_sp.AAC.1